MMSPTPLNLARERSLYTSFADRSLWLHRQELARLQEQSSTGLRVNRASDDAAAFGEARRMDVLIDRYGQYERSLGIADSWLDASQAALDQLAESFVLAYEHGTRAQNAIFNQDDLDLIANRLEAVKDSTVDYLNSQHGGEYLFAGTKTTVQPFTASGTTVTYNGNAGNRTRQIGPDYEMAINIDGQRLHEMPDGTTITGALQSLIDAVKSGDQPQIEAAMGQVQAARDHVIELGGEAGSMAERITMAREQVGDAERIAQQRRSEAQDADYAETIVNLHRTQTSLQAALQVTASIMGTSLLDYLN